MEGITGLIKELDIEGSKRTSHDDKQSTELMQLSPLERRKREKPWNFSNPERDQPRQHEGDCTQAEAQFKETLNAIGECYNFYAGFANFIKKIEGFTAQPQSQVRLEEWQKLARGAKVFQDFPGSQINRLDLVNKLSSLLNRDMEQLNDYIPPDSKESFKKALRMFAYIKSDKHHAFSVPQEKAQQIELDCRNTFRRRSQELRQRYAIRQDPECKYIPTDLAEEFGGRERFIKMNMTAFERLDLPENANEEAIQQALSRGANRDYWYFVNRMDNVIIIMNISRNSDAYTGPRLAKLLAQGMPLMQAAETEIEGWKDPKNYDFAKTG